MGSTCIWAQNLFISWASCFLLWVIFCSESQLCTRFRKPSFSPDIVILILSIFSLELPTPFSQSILLFIAWGEWRCHDYFLTCAKGGLILSFLSGCSVEKGGNGIGIDSHLQKTARQWYSLRHFRVAEYRASSSYDTPDQVKDVWEGLALGTWDSTISFQLLGLD